MSSQQYLEVSFSWQLLPVLSMVIILPLTTISKNPTSYLPCLTLERSHYLLLHRANEAVDMAFSLRPWVPAVCQGLLGTGERETHRASSHAVC